MTVVMNPSGDSRRMDGVPFHMLSVKISVPSSVIASALGQITVCGVERSVDSRLLADSNGGSGDEDDLPGRRAPEG